MLGVGIIGCGAIARLHIQSFLELPQTRVAAVADAHEPAAKKAGQELGVPCYTNFREMLAREDVQAVSICTPSGLHSEAAVAAARAGKHVIVEKPLDVTLEKIDAVIAACREAGVKLNCIFNNRYRESNLFLKRAVDQGRFGRLLNANAVIRWYRQPEYYTQSSWHGTWSMDGGGALMNQSIHYIDLLLWLAGDVSDVSAYRGTLLHKTMETEDTAVAALRFQNGALGTVLAATSIYPGYPAIIQLAGERGSASVTDGIILDWNFLDSDPMDEEAKQFITNAAVDNNRAAVPMAFDHTYHKKQIARAVDSILEDVQPDIGGEEARRSVELILRIYESAAKNERQ